MSQEYWRAKIWGLLHDPILKALHNNSGRGENSFYKQLKIMQPWVEIGKTPDDSGGKALTNILLADYIASASDRSAIGSTTVTVNYAPGNDQNQGLQIRHLLSGEKQDFKIKLHHELISGKRLDFLEPKEQELLKLVPSELQTENIENDIEKIKQLYWWLWRCLPPATCDLFNDSSLMLMPAETRIPDASIWSHVSMTSALAGALAGYDLTLDEIKNWPRKKEVSHPYLAVFSFTPVQELIKSSRKMRDFWAGSWLLHYLSAKVCWQLATQYGPDTLLYPSLYQQPLIDNWLLKKYPEFKKWIKQPENDQLLTAGFPNVLVLVLPKAKVKAAMQTAKQTLLAEWLKIGNLVLKELQIERHWMQDLKSEDNTWEGWLKSQWQFYWTALPIGTPNQEFKFSADAKKDVEFQTWSDAQNKTYNLTTEEYQLFKQKELELLREAHQKRWERQKRGFSANVGSWWGYIFDATRTSLAAVKNPRNWQIPTAFGPRSTISGIGAVVKPGKEGEKRKDWITEGETQQLWKHDAGLFDGTEQLNATEVLKRGLHHVLPQLLDINSLEISYPDLTSGVAGYLKVHQNQPEHKRHFETACAKILNKLEQDFPEAKEKISEMVGKWGIPWIDDDKTKPKKYHPRLLNAGWILEELPNIDDDFQEIYRTEINEFYPQNNPSNWYVLAAGDGDGMSEWLKGTKMKTYGEYVPDGFEAKVTTSLTKFPEFLKLQKRMGPSTHSALSRALLDFSNQLVPYLTQKRYAGKLIYGGGDDVLSYLNLWEWDKWLWDIRQCFKGAEDPNNEFSNKGDYWQYLNDDKDELEKVGLVDRPLFTMGSAATISFGVVIAHHSVPLAIALESLWEAEEKAKEHEYYSGCQLPTEKRDKKDCFNKKDTVQVRVLYGNGNTLKATSKFDVFNNWQQLITGTEESAIIEQAASLWSQHPVPSLEAIRPWTKAFCSRREQLKTDTEKQEFEKKLADFFTALFITTEPKQLDNEIQSWLKLAAFIKRTREVNVMGRWGDGVNELPITNYQLPITNYQLPIIMTYWYKLTPLDILMLRDAKPFSPQQRAWAGSIFPPNGHSIAGAFRGLLAERKDLKITGPFLCYQNPENTLYIPRPLGFYKSIPLVPLTWETDSHIHNALWDETQPCPLVKHYQNQQEKEEEENENLQTGEGNSEIKFRQYLPFNVVKKYLEYGRIEKQDWQIIDGSYEDKPYQIETRSHNTIKPETKQVKDSDGYFVENAIRLHQNWIFAIGINQKIETPTTIRLGGEGHRVIVESCPELGEQWQELQKISQANFANDDKSIAYLVTPGVFERPHTDRQKNRLNLCRPYPWEWKLKSNHPDGNFVSMSTEKPVPISCRIRDENDGKSIPAPQVFAAPPGSLYYLHKPQELFQDVTASKVKNWRQLGYSEMLWIRFQEIREEKNG